jgi:hypothetical protein
MQTVEAKVKVISLWLQGTDVEVALNAVIIDAAVLKILKEPNWNSLRCKKRLARAFRKLKPNQRALIGDS